MRKLTLRERVQIIEDELRALKNQITATSPNTAWRTTVGMFRGDPIFKQIIEEGQKLRQAERDAL